MNPENRDLIKRIEKVRNFPTDTFPVSRHVEIIGETLAAGKPYPMIEEEPEYVATSLLATVLLLYEARAEIRHLNENGSNRNAD